MVVVCNGGGVSINIKIIHNKHTKQYMSYTTLPMLTRRYTCLHIVTHAYLQLIYHYYYLIQIEFYSSSSGGSSSSSGSGSSSSGSSDVDEYYHHKYHYYYHRQYPHLSLNFSGATKFNKVHNSSVVFCIGVPVNSNELM